MTTEGEGVTQCPNCMGDDLSTGPVTDGTEQTVCFTCGWDTANGVTSKRCPGGCGAWISDGLLCCDPCWKRVPTRVPGYPDPWRRARLSARGFGSYRQFEKATDAARAWLIANPFRGVS